MFIKDSAGKPVGLLCINFDDSRFNELSEKLMAVVHPEVFRGGTPVLNKTLSVSQEAPLEEPLQITENFAMDIGTLMQKMFDETTVSLETPLDHLNQYERKDIITKLNEKGLFQLKGAISFVAKKFSCSTATIYRYLSEITN